MSSYHLEFLYWPYAGHIQYLVTLSFQQCPSVCWSRATNLVLCSFFHDLSYVMAQECVWFLPVCISSPILKQIYFGPSHCTSETGSPLGLWICRSRGKTLVFYGDSDLLAQLPLQNVPLYKQIIKISIKLLTSTTLWFVLSGFFRQLEAGVTFVC